MILEILLALCEEFNIPSWAAQTLKNAHDEIAGITDCDSIRYSVANHAYHQLLVDHEDIGLLAMAYDSFAAA